MTWQSVSGVTNYRDAFNQLIQIATSRNMATIAINAAGTGYTVNDILTINNTGSTRTHDASIHVVAVGGGGAITAARINNGGAYTVDPTTLTGNAASGGTGTGATFNLTFAATGWTVQRRTMEALSATVATAGTGYAVGNQLTLALTGGVQGHGGVNAVFSVATIGGGGSVTSVTLVTAGNYEKTPTNPNMVTGGAGSGCELTVTYQNATTQNNMLAILLGTASGAVAPLVGIKLWQGMNIAATNTTFNWALFGMTQFNNLVPFHQQADLSPGLQASGAIVTTNTGVWTPLKDTDAFNMDLFVSVTGRRIMGAAKVRTASTTFYVPFHLGLLNPLGTTQEYQYPMLIAGCTNRLTCWYADTNAVLSGLTEMVFRDSDGGAYLWYPEGSQWVTLRNADLSSDTDLTPAPGGSQNDDDGTYPAFRSQAQPNVADQIVTSTAGFDWQNIIFNDIAGALEVFPTVGNSLDMIVPVIAMRSDVTANPEVFAHVGEIDGLFWTSAANGQSSEGTILISTTRYKLFQNGNRIQTYSFCAFREN